MKGHYVYIVRCADQSFYTGYATDVAQRLAVHNTGKGARYTRTRLPVELLAVWSFASKTEALKREYQIKQLTRSEKFNLIAGNNTGVEPRYGQKSAR